MVWISRRISRGQLSRWGKNAFSGLSDYRHGTAKIPTGNLSFLPHRRREQITTHIKLVLANGSSSYFENEGLCIAALRSRFCLEGNVWDKSDFEARAIVSDALKRMGAVRPRYEEGQPEYIIAKENCKCCGGDLDEEDIQKGRRYCSQDCISFARLHRSEIFSFYEKQSYKRAFYLDAVKAATPRSCQRCGSTFSSVRKTQDFCSNECRGASRLKENREKICECCGDVFRDKGTLDRHNKYCGIRCYEVMRKSGVEKECECCGAKFTSFSSRGRFCNTKCADKAKYQKRVSVRISANVIQFNPAGSLTAVIFDSWFKVAA